VGRRAVAAFIQMPRRVSSTTCHRRRSAASWVLPCRVIQQYLRRRPLSDTAHLAATSPNRSSRSDTFSRKSARTYANGVRVLQPNRPESRNELSGEPGAVQCCSSRRACCAATCWSCRLPSAFAPLRPRAHDPHQAGHRTDLGPSAVARGGRWHRPFAFTEQAGTRLSCGHSRPAYPPARRSAGCKLRYSRTSSCILSISARKPATARW
jgi:hypothetical protein